VSEEVISKSGGGFRLRRFWNRTSAVWAQPTVIIAAVLFILLTYLVIAPVIALSINSVQAGVRDSAVIGLEPGVFTLYFLKRVFSSGVSRVLFWAPLVRTLFVALMTAALALPLGAALAWLVVRTDVPGRRWLSSAFVIPYILPSWTFAVVWLTLFKNRRLGGLPSFAESLGLSPPDWLAYGAVPIILSEALHLFPFAFLLFGNALRSLDVQLEESARVLGASGPVVARRIVLPLLLPALLAALLLTFTRVLGSFGTPYILGSPTRYTVLPTALYSAFVTGSTGVSAVIAVVIIVIGISLVTMDIVLVREHRRFVTIGGRGSARRIARLGRARTPTAIAVNLVFVLTTVVPLVTLVLATVMKRPGVFALHNLSPVYWLGATIPAMPGQRGLLLSPDIWHAAWNSLRVAGLAAIFCGFGGLFVGYAVVRLPQARVSRYLRQVSFLPYLVPSIAFAAAYISLFAVPRGIVPSLYGTMLLLGLAMSAKYLPYASRAGISAMMQLGNEPEEAAQVCGASWPRRMTRIVIPLLKGGLMTGALLPFITGMKELSLVIMLATPGTELLTTQTLRFIQYGYSQLADGTVLIIVAIVVVLTFLAERLTGSNLASGLEGGA
jgi:iron(III) transport system permease protein